MPLTPGRRRLIWKIVLYGTLYLMFPVILLMIYLQVPGIVAAVVIVGMLYLMARADPASKG